MADKLHIEDPVPTEPGGVRENFTKSEYTTPCGVPKYQKIKNGLAGGDTGKWDNPQEDCLPGEKGT